MDFQSLPDKAKRKTGLVQPSASTANFELLSFLYKIQRYKPQSHFWAFSWQKVSVTGEHRLNPDLLI